MEATLSREAILSRLRTRFVGQHLELYQETDSTNTRAVALAQDGAPEGTTVVAERQGKGRGRLGRQWFAPEGSSLLMSVILRPSLVPVQAQRTTMICSLAAVEAIGEVSGLTASVKWPNDIMLHGKKLGGLLTELGARGNRLDYVVVGMGLNVNLNLADLPALMVPATSLSTEAGHAVSRLELLLALLQHIEAHYDRMAKGWSPHDAWRRHLSTIGQHVRASTTKEAIEGLAEDVDEDGALLVRTGQGRLRRVVVGDVTLRA